MEEVKNTDQKKFLVKLAGQLLKDQEELDELAVQISLGKAEVRDKFQAAKRQMKKSVHAFRTEINQDVREGQEWVKTMTDKLSHLELHLGKGKVRSRAKLEEQKRNILSAIDEVMDDIKKNPEVVKVADFFTKSADKIKLQMDLFEKKLDAEKTELTREFKAEMYDARANINSIIAKAKDKKGAVDLKLENFSHEIQSAYEHMKKAIKAL